MCVKITIHWQHKYMDSQKIFINNLKIYRKQAKLTQAQLATQIDKSFNYINGIECGASFPPPDVIDKICEVLKIKPVQLFDEDGCGVNIISGNRDKFIDEVSRNIYLRLKDDIKKSIEEEIDKVFD